MTTASLGSMALIVQKEGRRVSKIKKGAIDHILIKNAAQANRVDAEYAEYKENEVMPLAKGTSLRELCETVYPDKNGRPWQTPIHVIVSRHITTIGVKELCAQALQYMRKKQIANFYD